MNRAKQLLDVTTTVAMLVTCAVLIWVNLPKLQLLVSRHRGVVPRESVSLEGTPMKGGLKATVVILEFGDFECPYCGAFARDVLPILEAAYLATGKVRMQFRHAPISGHPHGVRAAAAAVCAGEGGRFWEMHDRLFRNQRSLDDLALARFAAAIGLDPVSFSECLDERGVKQVRSDQAGALALGITGVPTFYIGRVDPRGRLRVARVVSGNASATEFRVVLDDLLSSHE